MILQMRFFSQKMIFQALLCLDEKPEELKNTELRLWLKCRDDFGKSLNTKPEHVKRVYECIRTGKDKNIVDPDPDEIYSRRKERLSTFTDVSGEEGISVQFPDEGWGTSLENMSMFTRVEMNRQDNCTPPQKLKLV